jgi:hypothetical protein
MKRPVLVFTMGLLTFWLAACANTPPAPEWQASSYGALSGFTSAFLTGNSKVADIEFAHARSDISSTGRADLVVRADLVRCALRVASVEFDNCAATALTNTDVAEPERAYADYLSGRWQSLDGNRIALLPEQHRAVVAAKDDTTRLASLTALRDPLVRLIAAGVLFQQGNLSPAGVGLAVDSASAQGWRRPLLAWLGVQIKLAESTADDNATARIQRRIDLVLEKPGT